MELVQEQRQQTLEQLLDVSQSEAQKIAQLRARLAQLKAQLSEKELSLVEKKDRLAALKNDISKRPIAQKQDLAKADLIEEDRGGKKIT